MSSFEVNVWYPEALGNPSFMISDREIILSSTFLSVITRVVIIGGVITGGDLYEK